MKRTPVRMVSLAIILIFFTGSMVSIADPGLLQIGSSGLSNDMSVTVQRSVNFLGSTEVGATITGTISFSTQNPLSVWSASNGNSYVISVPSSANFFQSAQLNWEYSTAMGSYPNYGINGFQIWETVLYESYNENSQHYMQWETQYNGSGETLTNINNVLAPQNFPAFDFNMNSSSAPYYSQYGVYKFEFQWQINDGWNGASGWHALPALYAEVYVMPGTGSLNPPATVQINNPVSITGTLSYGSYYLLVTAPDGSQQTIQLGESQSISTSFSKSYTPTQLGKYKVELVNSVVQLTTTQFFSASIVLPTPTILVTTPASSGYYTVGEQVTYTVNLQYNSTIPLQFNLYIWSGVLNQQPNSGSGQFIDENIFVTPTHSGTQYTYNGTFVIPQNALQTGAVSILAYATYTASNGTFYASNPAKAQISVGHTTTSSTGLNWLSIVEGVAIFFIGIILAIVIPDTVPMRILIVGSGVVFALSISGALSGVI